ncbi:MAG: hypothetical protein A3B96_00470 [Candidatus Spechtbacteria bacterium RIFCSPHIGHO2_02_FULL_43_15b]|uniref:UPF0102 protein A2827_03020 n=1 Tax=Candidatus Spechtbacteria bacterium RIFCSPHIGHO2_01_FULL_43_30 TaxID=1802158 RepID=A0A1G2H4Y6_9BACT|nr:MAG: hypothetical protein A2827_03020 [Candidatus Spechtbacteria bacterium RIFCSPHIGHO2_01_FULL_43_30]OGZ59345.1 MAG: hypothetical protein A3B96_00470 [Candidatus Spechtbacteria bacterium RIFCSPHIGHO2_02_FULL_43_15b]
MAKTLKRRKGDLGEEIGAEYLKDNGYKIIERNHSDKFGELDIIVKKGKVIVFVEVKSQEMIGENSLFPERNVDDRKQKKLILAAERYLIENNYPDNTEWQIDVIGVELNMDIRRAHVRHTKNAVSSRFF